MDTTINTINLGKYRLSEEQIESMTSAELRNHSTRLKQTLDKYVVECKKNIYDYIIENLCKDINNDKSMNLVIDFIPDSHMVLEISSGEPSKRRCMCCHPDFRSVGFIRDCFGGPYRREIFNRNMEPGDYKIYVVSNIYFDGFCITEDNKPNVKGKKKNDKKSIACLVNILSTLNKNDEVRKFFSDYLLTTVDSYEEARRLYYEYDEIIRKKISKERLAEFHQRQQWLANMAVESNAKYIRIKVCTGYTMCYENSYIFEYSGDQRRCEIFPDDDELWYADEPKEAVINDYQDIKYIWVPVDQIKSVETEHKE